MGIEPFPFMAPPASNRGHGKGAGVVIGPDIDEAGVAPDIVNAIGISSGHVWTGKIMPLYLARLFRGMPLLAGIVVIAKQFFLFRIRRDHRPALRQIALHGSVDVTELRVAMRMVRSLFGFAVAL